MLTSKNDSDVTNAWGSINPPRINFFAIDYEKKIILNQFTSFVWWIIQIGKLK